MKKAYSNNTKNTVYIGGLGIPPGETRMVEAQFVDQPEPEEEDMPDPDPVRELLALKVGEIESVLDDEDTIIELDILEAALATEESRSKPRSGAVAALNEAILAAASGKADPDDPNADQGNR